MGSKSSKELSPTPTLLPTETGARTIWPLVPWNASIEVALPTELWQMVVGYHTESERWMLAEIPFFFKYSKLLATKSSALLFQALATGNARDKADSMLQLAAREGSVNVLEWNFTREPAVWAWSGLAWKNTLPVCLRNAAMSETSDALLWLIGTWEAIRPREFQIGWWDDVLLCAIQHGCLKNVILLRQMGLKWPPHAMHFLIRFKRIDVLRWMESSAEDGQNRWVLQQSTPFGTLFNLAAQYADVDMWQWLAVRYSMLDNVSRFTFRMACVHGNVAVLKEIHRHSNLWRTWWDNDASSVWRFSANLAFAGSTATIDWLLMNGAKTPTTSHECEQFATKNRLDLIQHVRTIVPHHIETDDDKSELPTETATATETDPRWPWSEDVCRIASRHADKTLLTWLVSNGCPCPPDIRPHNNASRPTRR